MGEHYLTAPEQAMPMTLKLEDMNTGEVYFDWRPSKDQWWINGFDVQVPDNVLKENMKMTATIDFSGNPKLHEGFEAKYRGYEADTGEYKKWAFDSKRKTATLIWRG